MLLALVVIVVPPLIHGASLFCPHGEERVVTRTLRGVETGESDMSLASSMARSLNASKCMLFRVPFIVFTHMFEYRLKHSMQTHFR